MNTFCVINYTNYIFVLWEPKIKWKHNQNIYLKFIKNNITNYKYLLDF